MNILAIHTSHDGAITVVKDDQFILHAQIDRFNHILSSAIPSKKLLIQIKSLKIKFDRLLITFLAGHNIRTFLVWPSSEPNSTTPVTI